MNCVDEVFGPGGLFASKFAGYEAREGQVQLARAIERAIANGEHLLAEGPCGTGKGVAYLVPAIYHAATERKKIVVATANIALQEQLVKKDLPSLAAILPWKFSFALLKGRNNYACVDAAETAQQSGSCKAYPQARAVFDWISSTETGDQSELSFIPEAALWSKVSVTAEKCKGEGCLYEYKCFANRAKARAMEVDVVVTNYHMLFANMALRMQKNCDLVIPSHDVLILDEAHEAAEIARDFFGFQVAEHGIETLAKIMGDKGANLARESKIFWATLAHYSRSGDYKRRLKRQNVVKSDALVRELDVAADLFRERADDENEATSRRATARLHFREASNAAGRIREAMTLADPDAVYWIEAGDRLKLRAKPIFVDELLRDEMFGRTKTVIMTSATMTTGDTFDFIRRECGVPKEAREVVADNPFDFRTQALCIVPASLPEPTDATFAEKLTGVVAEVIERARGRTLALFTSNRNMHAVHDGVSKTCKFRILKQHDAPRTELTKAFREDVSSCLFGVESFWTGIDVQGESLSCVIVDKFPFASPDDPIVDAICERDRSAFMNYSVPRAIMMFRQGVGRLIRSKGDRGVIVMCDVRAVTKTYGQLFIRSLPKMQYTRKLGDIDAFLNDIA